MGPAAHRQDDRGTAINGKQCLFPADPRSGEFWRRRWLAALALTALLAVGCAAPPSPPSSREQRAPVHSAAAGEAVAVTVTVDRREVSEVRLYFKPMSASDYLYLLMSPTGENDFSAQLPPSKNAVKGLDYLLLFVNDQGLSRKTKPFRLLILKNYRQTAMTEEPVIVYGEQGIAPAFHEAFAVPFEVQPSPKPLLGEAEENAYPTIVPESSATPSLPPFSGPGGFSFSLKVGGFGLFYGGR